METRTLKAGLVMTVVAAASSSGLVGRLGDKAGEPDFGPVAIAAGQTKVIGPFHADRRYGVTTTQGTIAITIAPQSDDALPLASDYGIDFMSVGDTETGATGQPMVIAKAILRSPSGWCLMECEGVPVDGDGGETAGTGFGFAVKGSLCIDVTNGDLYKNTGDAEEPTWIELAEVAP